MVCESLELSPSQFTRPNTVTKAPALASPGSQSPYSGHRHLPAGLDRAGDHREADRRQRARRRPGRPRVRLTSAVSPAALKKAIGDCLRDNGHYAPLLEEMPRCWRLNYANEFHMDITPSIPNPTCRRRRARSRQDGQDVEGVKPEGLQAAVRVARQARSSYRLRKHALDSARASIEPYPRSAASRGSCAARCRL